MGRRFDAVIFDAGGVLVIPSHEVLGPLVARHGGDGSQSSIHRAHYAGMRAQDVHSVREQDWIVYREAFLAAAGVPDEHEVAASVELRALWESDNDLWRWPLTESVEALHLLNAAAIPIAVVSNAEGQIAHTLARTGVCQVGPGAGANVAVVIDSHIVGVSKPDPRIFSFAIDVLGIDRSRVIYVGDSVGKDVVGARNAGLHPLHLDPYGDHHDAEHDRISSLMDLFDWLA
ncbi:MAG: HAD family hydrolase [Acidimicrobiia bacterium]